MKLHTYFRSSAAYRVRIALNLKGIAHELVPVHLIKDGGQHLAPAYRAKSPLALVPALELDDGTVITESLAILEYLEEICPTPSILPADAVARAQSRAVANIICCDIHPIDNLRVLQYLKGPMGQPQGAVDAWYAHWIRLGFAAIERLIGDAGFCFGDRPTIADLCLVPQIFNARRFAVPIEAFPRIRRVEALCAEIPAFIAAHPSKQPDAE